MKIKLTHITEYKYEKPVFLEPHIFRFTPQQNIFVTLLDYDIQVLPDTSSVYPVKTSNGNCFCAAFNDLTDYFKVTHKSTIDFKEFNPFNFFVYPAQFNKLPFTSINDFFKEYCYFNKKTDSGQVIELANRLLKEAQYETLRFLDIVNSYLNRNIKYGKRETGKARKGEETLIKSEGSCRDITQLFIEICRIAGIPARFVSGYYIPVELEKEKLELHAWAEAYIPGGGWIGYDPTHEIVCFGRHIALAASLFAEETLPVSGFYRGTAKSEIKYKVDVNIDG